MRKSLRTALSAWPAANAADLPNTATRFFFPTWRLRFSSAERRRTKPRLTRVSARFRLTSSVPRGNIGRWARPPNLQELFGNRGVVHGNPNLKPEVAHNRDVGFRWTRSVLGPVLTNVGFEFAYFNNQIDDLIALRRNTPSIATPVNISAASVKGQEVALNAQLWQRVGLIANYTHQNGVNESSIPSLRGKQLPGRPASEAYGRIELTWSPAHPLPIGDAAASLWPGRLYFDTNLIADNFLDQVNAPSQHVSGRTYYGAGVEIALPGSPLRVTFEVKNAGNDQTRDVFAFPLPGRTFFTTVSYGFGRRDNSAPP